jgi:cell wall assembly regulator SMI1
MRRQIEAELEKLSPDLLTQLRPGVDDATIAQVEHLLGFSLPEEVKAFFREHNGSVGPFFGNWVLFSLEEVCREWEALKAMHPQAMFEGKDDPLNTWNPSWLPFMQAGITPNLVK